MKYRNILLTTLVVLSSTALLAGCSSQGEREHTLRVLNWEDYIYQPTEDGEPSALLDQFVDYIEEKDGYRPTIVYDTFDTNETMLNSLKTGKYTYDLICPSDYMIQKMLSQDLLEPYDFSQMPNYVSHCSPYLRNIFKDIKSTSVANGTEYVVDDYAVGYMWGTLGILYNPAFKDLADIPEEQIAEDMGDWNALWDSKYSKTISIKDSMRDTYSIGIMRVYDQDRPDLGVEKGFTTLKNEFADGIISSVEYNASLTKIFNMHDDATVAAVQQALIDLKSNIFGFEVDSGKEDITTGKIGINTAWSGDAVYSMDKGDAYGESGVTLYYKIPETGGNIWFDGWVMPKSDTLNKKLAEEFVDFLSSPSNAALNMYGIGYSSFIGGDEIMEQLKMWYDPRAYELFQYDESAGDWVYDEEGNYVPIEGMEDKSWNDIAPSEDWYTIDLSYFFDETGDYTLDDMTFYSTEINRQFSTQYPDINEIDHLAIMADYGEANSKILNMWEIVKSDSLPLWAILLFAAEIILAAGLIAYFLIRRQINKNRRAQRKAKNA